MNEVKLVDIKFVYKCFEQLKWHCLCCHNNLATWCCVPG